MSFFSRLFGRSQPVPDPETLRQQLRAAQNDHRALERLCRTHRALIVQHFPSWQQVPVEIRDKQAELENYLQGLLAVAIVFEQRLGDPSLIQRLMGPPESNPIVRWQQSLQEARKLKEELRYAEAVEKLNDLLIDVRSLKGSAVDAYLPVTLGELGECYFQSGEGNKAIAPTEQALEHVRRVGDAEGIRAYLGNLYEMHRYLDQPQKAADYADQLADHLDRFNQPHEARRYRNQARLVRQGEPLNRVVLEMNGVRYEVDEVLHGIEGGVRFYFERNKLMLHSAEVLTQRGEKEASQGRFDEGLSLFREAARADPFAPNPHFQAAVTLMHLDRPSEAIDEYARTEELAPGWFHCRSEMWLAQQIVMGHCDIKLFLLLRIIEDAADLTTAKRKQLIDQGLQQAPDLPFFHYQLGKLLRDQPASAITAYRRGLTVADEPDIRTRLLVELAGLLDPGPERRALLEEALSLEGNLVAQATARLMLHFNEG
jgi:tetratricopeptide (TPR) repeat protein